MRPERGRDVLHGVDLGDFKENLRVVSPIKYMTISR